jgi:DNA polymerase-1
MSVITLDLETTGLDWTKDRIILEGYKVDGDSIVQNTFTRPCDRLLVLLREQSNTLRGHNIKFDAHFLRMAGYDLQCSLEDTRVLAYHCWPTLDNFDLKSLVKAKLGDSPTQLEDILFKPLKKELGHLEDYSSFYYQIDKRFVRKELLELYHRADIENVDRLRALMTPTDWFTEVEMPLTRMIYEMEAYGCPLDVSHLEKLKEEYSRKERILLLKLGASDDFNPGSTDQVASRLTELGYDLDELCDKTETGKYQIDKALLKNLAEKGEQFAKDILEFRKVRKNLSTYIDPFIEKARTTRRLHGSFNQAGSEDAYGEGARGTRTGRLSSSEPNLQNIPSRTEEGRAVRKAFIAPEGEVMFDSDLSQIEPRLIGHFSQSPKLIKAYNENLDTHGLFASDIFNKRMEDLTKTERFIGKSSWLATVYGCSYKKLLYICESFSDGPLQLPDISRFKSSWGWLPLNRRAALVSKYGKEVEEIYPKWMFFKEVQDNFKAKNPEIMSWRESHITRTRRLGYVVTLGGRVIQIDGLNSNDPMTKAAAERSAVNFLIQGSGADVMKLIMVAFNEKMVKTGKAKVFAVIHDELLGSLGNKDDLSGVKEVMENTVSLRGIPIKADSKIVTSWGDKG